MMQNNFSFNSPEKVTTNNTTLISDDKFISLINNLSELIKDYYYTSKNNINEIFDIIKEKEENNIKKLFTQIDKQKKNLNIFVEKAKDIFKKMRIHKNSKSSGLTNSINSNIKNMNNLNNVIKIYDDYNSVNKKKNKNIIELKITSKFRTEDDSNKIINNTYNAFNTNIYNKTEKKYSNINSNLENIKNLIQKLSSYENIISKVSLKYKDNFKQLQNDINYLLDKCIYDKGRNSLKNNSSFYNEINNISNNGYDMNNYSFNFNNINPELPKKNLLDDFNIKNDYNPYDMKISDLKMKNNLYKEKIKDLEFQVEDLNSTIETLENTLSDLGMNIAEAVTIFLKQVVMTDSIPFIIRKPKLNAETIKAMEDAEKGIGLSKAYTDVEEMLKDLKEEDVE